MGTLSSQYPNSNAVEAALDRANSAAHDVSILNTEMTDVLARVDNKVNKSDIPYVTPQMFGAIGDGVTDDTDAFITAINDEKNVLFIPNGTYVISRTLSVDHSMTIEGESRYRSRIKYVGEGYLFDVSTNANEVANIKNLYLTTISDNKCIKCEIENHWGASMIIDNCTISGFSVVFDFVSAFGCVIKNVRILSNGAINFSPFSASQPDYLTFCNNNTFENVYYTGYPSNTPTIINASNCRGLALNSCTFEKADLFINYINKSRNITVNDCWFEKITQFEEKSSDSRALWLNATVMPEVSRLGSSEESFSGLSHTSQFEYGFESRIENNQVLREIYNEDKRLLNYYISNEGYDPAWVLLYDMRTSGIKSRIPYNIQVKKVNDEAELKFNLRDFYYHINASAICEIDVIVTYSDTSILWFRNRVLMVNAASYRKGTDEVFQKDNWGIASTSNESSIIDITNNEGIFRFTSEIDTPLQIAFIIHDIPLGNNI